jgi:RNA polymerase sigma factor (sigma-70 family)
MASPGPGPEQEVTLSLSDAAVRKALGQLPEEERQVVKLRYGINGDAPPRPLEQIGQALGRSPRDIREIERRALEHLAISRELEGLLEAA